MALRVGITGVSGDVGRGAILGLRRNRPSDEPIHLIGLDAGTKPLELGSLGSFVQLPRVADAGYVEALISTLQAYKIDVLLPGIDSEIRILSAARKRLAVANTKIVLAPEELVEAADDKLATARFLSRRGINVPPTKDAQSPDDIGFPLVAKPRQGHGSRGIAILRDSQALQDFLKTRPRNYCFQRLVDGPEITVGFLYDSQGVMRDAIAMERVLQDGRTVQGRVLDGSEIAEFIEDFGRKILCLGAVNAQLRWDKHEGPMVFEINARLSGSTEMRVAVGFNDPLRLALHFGRGLPIARARTSKATVRRVGGKLLVEPC